jgi:DNA gyrase subunit B
MEYEYTADSIEVLEGLEAVRKRPGMYIGTTGPRGLHHCVWEILDNAIDEVGAGFCNKIIVEIHSDGSLSVTDTGRGIPIDIHLKMGIPAVRVAFEILHAGGKFNNTVYKTSGGLHGVGCSVVNALSIWVKIDIKKHGNLYHLEYENGGHIKSDLQIVETNIKQTGTRVQFMPDPAVFKESTTFNQETIKARLRELAYLNGGLEIEFRANGKIETFFEKTGIVGLAVSLADSPVHNSSVYYRGERDCVITECALIYNDSDEETLCSYANNIPTIEGGLHEKGFRTALTRVFNQYAKSNNLFKGDESFDGIDCRGGLIAVLSVRLADPQFEGQTKTKLGNSEIEGIVQSLTNEGVGNFLEQNPTIAKDIFTKLRTNMQERLAAKKAKEIKKKVKNAELKALSGKLAACSEKNPKINELFLVEGDSAGGSAKSGRDRKFQAILPLRGKVLNTYRAKLDKVLENEEIRSMITAIGAGVGKEFDVAKSNYDKVCIMTDADQDGAHIRTLLLTFFYRYMKPLLLEGHVYIALSPLFKVQKGKTIQYAYDEAELKTMLKSLGKMPVFSAIKV